MERIPCLTTVWAARSGAWVLEGTRRDATALTYRVEVSFPLFTMDDLNHDDNDHERQAMQRHIEDGRARLTAEPEWFARAMAPNRVVSWAARIEEVGCSLLPAKTCGFDVVTQVVQPLEYHMQSYVETDDPREYDARDPETAMQLESYKGERDFLTMQGDRMASHWAPGQRLGFSKQQQQQQQEEENMRALDEWLEGGENMMIDKMDI
jgi:hypothetical protein